MGDIARRWRDYRKRRDQRRHYAQIKRVKQAAPLTVICTPTTWARIVTLTTYLLPDSDYISSPFRDLAQHPHDTSRIRIELDATDLGILYRKSGIDPQQALLLFSSSDVAFLANLHTHLTASIEAKARHPNRPTPPVHFDPPP